MTLNVQLVGSTTQMAIVTLPVGQIVYSEAGKFLFSSGDVQMETKMTAPGDEGPGGVGGLIRGAVSAGRRMLTGESLAVTHFFTRGGDGLVAFAGVIPGEMRAIELQKGETWFAEKDAFVAAEAGVNQSIAFSGLSQGLMGGEGFLLQKFEGTGTLLVGGSGDFVDINPADYGGEIVVDTGCIVAWDQNITYGIKAVGRLNRQGVMNALLGGEGFTLATLRGNGRVILQSVTLQGLATALAKSARMSGSTQNGNTGFGAIGSMFGGNE
ncbi:conserved hypothetical protein [metagenome]|uniref:TIGR00266 family protein n=1 Tax=metagenome TaxID=256318 RepID=A0A2P2CCH0_9ZZZZ